MKNTAIVSNQITEISPALRLLLVFKIYVCVGLHLRIATAFVPPFIAGLVVGLLVPTSSLHLAVVVVDHGTFLRLVLRAHHYRGRAKGSIGKTDGVGAAAFHHDIAIAAFDLRVATEERI